MGWSALHNVRRALPRTERPPLVARRSLYLRTQKISPHFMVLALLALVPAPSCGGSGQDVADPDGGSRAANGGTGAGGTISGGSSTGGSTTGGSTSGGSTTGGSTTGGSATAGSATGGSGSVGVGGSSGEAGGPIGAAGSDVGSSGSGATSAGTSSIGTGGSVSSGGTGGTPWSDPGGEGDCSGVYHPDRVHEYDIKLTEADWAALRADTTNDVYFPAEMRCGDGAPLAVGIRRKRSGGTLKIGFKIDINWQVEGQTFFGLKKLSLENGISEGSDEVGAGALMSEYLGWRLMVLSGAVTGHASLARVTVNGTDLGVYVNVEQVDKRFLDNRLGDDSGWLYKKSGSPDDGYKTNESEPNPYADYFCFWERSCDAPSSSELFVSLPEHLDIEQMLRVAAVNALIANTDTLLQKDNNYIFYDRAAGPRLYFPWDLDTSMRKDLDVFTGTVPGGTDAFRDVLFSNWEGDYDRILTELLAGPLALTVIDAELDRMLAAAATAFDADPWLSSGSDDAGALRAWWSARHPAVVASVEAH
jgi:hypothetical protein